MAVTKFKQIKKFCDDNDIELICVTSSITPSVMKKLGMGIVNDVLSQFLKNRMYLIIILTKRLSVLDRSDLDYGDKEGHMGGELAEEYSESIGVKY